MHDHPQHFGETAAGGWLSIATAGSASQLSSRTVQTAVCDEVSRWPRAVRSGEGAPLALIEARTADWGDDAVIVALSSPVQDGDGITQLFRDGDQRRMEYPCPSCHAMTPFLWEQVIGVERHEKPMITCANCDQAHDERARLKMLRRGRWVAQRPDAVDEDTASFSASRLDSARSSLHQVAKSWRKARRRGERGDARAVASWRNLVLGRPSKSGAADADQLYARRERAFDLRELEQTVAAIDVQDDRLISVVAGFSRGSNDVFVFDLAVHLGDPRDDAPWQIVERHLDQTFGGMRISIVGVDAGHLTSTVREQCRRRRAWCPVLGRAGRGAPIARPIPSSGIATMGKENVCAWWAGRVGAHRVHLPQNIARADVEELCCAEALVARGGALRWEPILPGGRNHYWDCATICVWARHFKTVTSTRRKLHLVAI